jgi:hypothetical protein
MAGAGVRVVTMQRAIVLAAYRAGLPDAEMFAAVERPIPSPREGEALVRTAWLSLDPFPRMQMTGADGGPPQLPLGEVVIGRGAAEVVATKRADLAVGDWVVCEPGWQEYALVAGPVRKAESADRARAALGVLGPSGLTAHFALADVIELRPDDVVFISAAAGSVGAAACQLAQRRGATVIAGVSGEAQAAFARDSLGVARIVDRLGTDNLTGALSAAAPHGLSAALDTVGGTTFEAILSAARPRARLALVGFISAYGGERPRYIDPYALIMKRVRLEGFLLADHAAKFAQAQAELDALFDSGALRAHENIAKGLAKAPAAFANLFQSAPPGKQLVEVAGAAGE